MSMRSRQTTALRQEDNNEEDRRGGGGGTERRRGKRDLAPPNVGGGTLPPVIDKVVKRKNQVDAGALKSLPKLIQLNDWTKSADKTVDELVYGRFLLSENRRETKTLIQNEENRVTTNRDDNNAVNRSSIAKQRNRFRFDDLHSRNNSKMFPAVRKFDASDSERSGRLGKTEKTEDPDLENRKNRFSANSVPWKPSNSLWYRSDVENAQQPSSVEEEEEAADGRGKGIGGRSEKSSTADGQKEQRRTMLTLLKGRLRSVDKSQEVASSRLHPTDPSGNSVSRSLDRPLRPWNGEGGREDGAADADVQRYIRDNDLMPPEKEDWIKEWLRAVSPSMRDEVLDLHILEADKETEATRT